MGAQNFSVIFAVASMVISAPVAQAGICDDLDRFMAAAKKKPAFAPLSEAIAQGKTIGYVQPASEWGMGENKKCRIVAKWKTKPRNPKNHGAYIECEIARHYGKPLADTAAFTDALSRTQAAMENCPALAKYTQGTISEGDNYTNYQKLGTSWTRRKKHPVVSVFYKRDKTRRNRGYYTHMRVEMPLR